MCKGTAVGSNGDTAHSAWLPGPAAQTHRALEPEGQDKHTHSEEIELLLFNNR